MTTSLADLSDSLFQTLKYEHQQGKLNDELAGIQISYNVDIKEISKEFGFKFGTESIVCLILESTLHTIYYNGKFDFFLDEGYNTCSFQNPYILPSVETALEAFGIKSIMQSLLQILYVTKKGTLESFTKEVCTTLSEAEDDSVSDEGAFKRLVKYFGEIPEYNDLIVFHIEAVQDIDNLIGGTPLFLYSRLQRGEFGESKFIFCDGSELIGIKKNTDTDPDDLTYVESADQKNPENIPAIVSRIQVSLSERGLPQFTNEDFIIGFLAPQFATVEHNSTQPSVATGGGKPSSTFDEHPEFRADLVPGVNQRLSFFPTNFESFQIPGDHRIFFRYRPFGEGRQSSMCPLATTINYYMASLNAEQTIHILNQIADCGGPEYLLASAGGNENARNHAETSCGGSGNEQVALAYMIRMLPDPSNTADFKWKSEDQGVPPDDYNSKLFEYYGRMQQATMKERSDILLALLRDKTAVPLQFVKANKITGDTINSHFVTAVKVGDDVHIIDNVRSSEAGEPPLPTLFEDWHDIYFEGVAERYATIIDVIIDPFSSRTAFVDMCN